MMASNYLLGADSTAWLIKLAREDAFADQRIVSFLDRQSNSEESLVDTLSVVEREQVRLWLCGFFEWNAETISGIPSDVVEFILSLIIDLYQPALGSFPVVHVEAVALLLAIRAARVNARPVGTIRVLLPVEGPQAEGIDVDRRLDPGIAGLLNAEPPPAGDAVKEAWRNYARCCRWICTQDCVDRREVLPAMIEYGGFVVQAWGGCNKTPAAKRYEVLINRLIGSFGPR